jgi:hypothetical protein
MEKSEWRRMNGKELRRRVNIHTAKREWTRKKLFGLASVEKSDWKRVNIEE